MERRQFIAVAAGATTVGLAGCLGDDDVDTDSPEGIVESFYEIQQEADDIDDLADEADNLFHSESPWHEIIELGQMFEEEEEFEEEDEEIESLETEVVAENMGEDELMGEGELQFFDVEQSVIEDIAASENALVETTVETTGGDQEHGEHIVVEEGGEWQIFF